MNVPDARYYHTAIWTGNQMIVWGGYTSTAQTSTGGLYCSGGFYASIADSPSPAFFGSNLSYTITVTNTSGVTANNVVVSDTSYGSSFSFVSATPSQGSCSGTSPVSCNLGTINSSASATIVVVLTPLTTGSIINVANISSSNLFGDSATKITPRDSVSVTGEVIQESDETFFVNLNNPTNSTLVDSQGLGMILNDDSDACITPDERIYLYSVTLDININPVLSFQDFNQPNEVTGYNIYRSATPAPAHDPAWILKASSIVDGDASLANIQWVDFSGDPGTFYYQVVAYNNVCSGEGPW